MLNGKICFIADASEKTGQSVGFALGKQGAKLVLCLPQNKKPDELFLNVVSSNCNCQVCEVHFSLKTDKQTIYPRSKPILKKQTNTPQSKPLLLR